MSRKYHRILSVMIGLLLLLFVSPAATAGEWIPFGGGESGDLIEVSIPISDDQGVVVELTIPGMNVSEADQEGVTYNILDVPGTGHTNEIGQPQVPMVGRFIAIPSGATVGVEVVDSTFEELNDYYVYPAQEPLPDISGAPTPSFSIDGEAYQRNEFYPFRIVELEGPSVIRGCSTVILRVFPVQFNPATRSLRVYSNIRVKVFFEGGEAYFIEDRLRSPAFDKTFGRLFLNNPISESGEGIEAAYDSGNSLLIITHPNFLNAANTLKAWKVKKGIYTVVKTTTATGSTASAIQSYIKNAYDNWDPPPTYVLFIGDAEFIPCHYKTSHPYTSSPYQGRVGTDLYYATVDGSDYFPDISTGRLSVDTLSEATKRVNDIIGYERTPVTDSSFYGKAAICAYFQDRDYTGGPIDGYANRRFAQTSEDMAIYLSSSSYLGDYTVDRIYNTQSDVTPTNWGTASWNFGGGPAGNAGAAIPSYLLRSSGFAWDGDSSDIANAINAGRFLVTHRDHGATWGWGDPKYTTTNVQALTNGSKLPVVWSINCQTGWFDNETDDSVCGTSSSAIHFSEAWERNSNGGGVGVIAATRISYSGHNDRLIWGWMDAIWPNFVSSYSPSGTPFDNPIYEIGQVLNYGKYYYSTTYSESTYRKIEFEMFEWFGDPTMQIWTSVPGSLSVSHPSTLAVGAKSIAVTVNQSGALICVSKSGVILGRKVCTSGSNTVSWSTGLAAGDEINVTVTKHNYRPYEGTAKAGSGGTPGAATLVSPTGTITDTTPTYTWNAVSGATWYRLYVREGSSGSVHDQWYTASSVTSGSTCLVTPATTLNSGGHTWWIQTYNSYGYGPWSSGMSFTVSSSGGGFNSQFKGSATGWGSHSGVWYVNNEYLYTEGLSSNGSSVSYNATFTNFDYQVRLWRAEGCDDCANRIMVRGTPTPLGSTNWWNTGYVFQYTRNGSYSIYKVVNGSRTALKSWTSSSAINKASAWNTLRVVANGTTIHFYINGTYMGAITNTSLTSGRVGIGVYSTGTYYVDWAKLTTSTSASDVSEASSVDHFVIDDSLNRQALSEEEMDAVNEDLQGVSEMESGAFSGSEGMMEGPSGFDEMFDDGPPDAAKFQDWEPPSVDQGEGLELPEAVLNL